jgi:maltokinase
VHGKSEIFDERLLAAFAVEQEARELIYAARFLPRWTYAPMSVLRSWYPEE